VKLLVEGQVDAGTDEASLIALLNCLVREVSGPEHQITQDGEGHLEIRLARLGILLRARLARPVTGPAFRLAGPVAELRDTEWEQADELRDIEWEQADELRDTEWEPVGLDRLADLVAGELELATGLANPEFTGQVAAGHQALQAILAHRDDPADDRVTYLESEQALVTGHRFHPSPKARQGEPGEWLAYAPEVRARFPLRWLAVREELTAEEGVTDLLDGIAPRTPAGFRPLPAHPWQYALLRPRLAPAIAADLLRDLGTAGPEATATSSVRTVYLAAEDFFCKFSLDVRITNCVRKNSWYELTGAVALNRLLGPVFASLGETFDGCALLGEPGYRTAGLADRGLYEGLGVIVRSGLGETPGVPVLAGALADPYGLSAISLRRLLAAATGDEVMTWWTTYLRLVLPPTLYAYFRYGVVLEPHLQNVLVCLDPVTHHPTRAIFRDLEGTKLVRGMWDLTGLPGRVADALSYDADRGWDRVVYCLFVNHLAEIAAALADLHPGLEPALWDRARTTTAGYARLHHTSVPVRLRALLAGVPLPGKANLAARWSRSPDRTAAYVPVTNPFRSRTS
jgi:siderophore synthetase component